MCTCEIQNLLSGSVDIVVAKGIVALLILAVVLAGAHLESIDSGKYWLAGYTRYLYELTALGVVVWYSSSPNSTDLYF